MAVHQVESGLLPLDSYRRDFVSQFDIRLVARHRFEMLGIGQQHRKLPFEKSKNGFPIHASPNVAKTLLNWEYVIEILQVDLRTSAQNHPLPLSQHAAVSHEGSSPQGLGAAHVHQGQIAPAPTPVTGGHRHV